MIGLLGGTFNPVHLGHVSIAQDVKAHLDLSSVEFIPCHIPAHRNSPDKEHAISSQQRVDMLALALQDVAAFHVDLTEIKRGGVSFMIDTLKTLKQQFNAETLVLILGTDAFNGLKSWKSADQILQYCHIVVCQRPNEIAQNIYQNQWVENKASLTKQSFGLIYFLNVTAVCCSSTLIRENLYNKRSVAQYLSPPVLEFVQTNQLYENTPTDV